MPWLEILIDIKSSNVKNPITLFLNFLRQEMAWSLEDIIGSQLLLREQKEIRVRLARL